MASPTVIDVYCHTILHGSILNLVNTDVLYIIIYYQGL